MGAEIILLHKRLILVNVLPQRSTLSDFIAVSQSDPEVRKVSFYVLSGPEEIFENCPGIKQLPFYGKAIGADSWKRTLVEQPPFHLGKIAYKVTDTNFDLPLSFSSIKPLDDLTNYARESAMYIAQHGFETVSFLRFKPL